MLFKKDHPVSLRAPRAPSFTSSLTGASRRFRWCNQIFDSARCRFVGRGRSRMEWFTGALGGDQLSEWCASGRPPQVSAVAVSVVLVVVEPGAYGEGVALASGTQREREQKEHSGERSRVNREAREEGIPHKRSAARSGDESIDRAAWCVDGARAVWASFDAAHSHGGFHFLGSHGPFREGHGTQRTRIRKSAGWAEIVL